MEGDTKVCVTGPSGYVGSLLVKKLLEKGYIVHATLRNLEDKSKVDLLKSFPNAETNLFLFQADVYNSTEFEPAIQGCQFVFHVATPMLHDPKSSQYKNMVEATVAGAKRIVESCIKSKTVKRLIYTASVLSTSPLNEDGKSFKPILDESCWTPLHLSFSFANDFIMEYIKGRTQAEKLVLSYNENENDKLEVVTLATALIGGETILPHEVASIKVIYAQIAGDLIGYNGLRFMQEVLGSIPFVHVDDVCEAHIFCMEKSSLKGRFLCSVANPTSRDIAIYYTENYPQFKIDDKFMGEAAEREVKLEYSSKLTSMGFVFKHDLKNILDESLENGRRLGAIC